MNKIRKFNYLSNPVRAEDTESLKTTSNTFLGDGLQVPDWLHLVDHTGCLWLTIGATLGHWTFATSTTHGNAVDHITWNKGGYDTSKKSRDLVEHNFLACQVTNIPL